MKKSVLGLVVAGALAVGAEEVNDWENPQVNSVNRLPARTYSMPLADERAALTDALEPETPYKKSLNGTWKLSWAGNPDLRVRDFWKADFDDSRWFEIDVPSCVELRGFGTPGYSLGWGERIASAMMLRDKLIVGGSTDDVVREYKHHDPIVCFDERVAIVKAIRYVDEVVPQTSMDKFAAWQNLHFNRLFHGNDWKGSAMYNEVEAKLRAVGVEVVYFDYTQGTSSTLLAERLRG